MVTNPQYVVHDSRTRQARARMAQNAERRRGTLHTWLRTALERMRVRHELRHDLARIDERLSRDAGISLTELQREAAKPFWRR